MTPGAARLGGRFLIDPFEPAYLETERRGLLPAKVEAARRELADCLACPRDCGIDRLADERGVCHTG